MAFDDIPTFDYLPEEEYCIKDHCKLNTLKTNIRLKKTMRFGNFKAHETITICPKCGMQYRSKELARTVPVNCNFGYDVLVHVGRALFEKHLSEQTIVEQLSMKNLEISPSEVSFLGRKFIAYLTLAHQRSAPKIKQQMELKGGYILHLDATYEDKSPMLMTGLDSIMQLVLWNCKLRGENAEEIVPFLKEIKKLFGSPLALIHDMSKGIMKAISIVFPNVLDFICHFHFLRDIGKDLLETEYDNIRKRLTKHGITGKLNARLRQFRQTIDEEIPLINQLNIHDPGSDSELLNNMPVFAAYSLITWAFEGKKKGNGYGFPFDRPHLEFVKRLKTIHTDLDQIRYIKLYKDNSTNNKPLHKTYADLSSVINDRCLWKSVAKMEAEIVYFESLRSAMRIASKTSKNGLNSEGGGEKIGTIEKGVTAFRKKLLGEKGYKKNKLHQKMVTQLDKYWEKLFADPIEVDTIEGKKNIQPQRTNNYAEQSFRDLKRGYRKKTGNHSLGKTLRTMLANTPLVKNLQNPEYMTILLNGKSSLEEVFAEIGGEDVCNELKQAQSDIERVPAKIKTMIKEQDYPTTLKNFCFAIISNRIL